MTLQEKLDAMRAASKTRIPPEAQAIMHRSIEDLRASGITNRVARIGDPAPDFTLPNGVGQPVSLKGLVARGPAVLSFYRGRW
jgi:AhpC/TSA family protein